MQNPVAKTAQERKRRYHLAAIEHRFIAKEPWPLHYGRMNRFRKSLFVKRAAIGILAAYAFLLQAFAAAALPISIAPNGTASCAQDRPGTEPPSDAHGSSHGACCILACGACSFAYLPAPLATVHLPARSSKIERWPLESLTGVSRGALLSGSARGPPRTV